MYITIDEHDSRPIYRQIVDEIKALIAGGELTEGSSLPPVRQVAADLGVNLNTVATAYRQLRSEGLIKVRHGAGAVVISSRKLNGEIDEQTAKLLRTVLAHLCLVGLSKAEITSLVMKELNLLTKGSAT
jgi:GntR family transcriptional regulator